MVGWCWGGSSIPAGRAGIPAHPPGSKELLCSEKRLHVLPMEVEHLQRLLQLHAAKALDLNRVWSCAIIIYPSAGEAELILWKWL